MSDTVQNPQPDLAGSSPLDAAAVAKVVREELDRNNQYLQFAQGQIEKDRGFYKHLYGFAAAFLAVMVGLAVYVSSTSLSQMRADMQKSVDAELVGLRVEANLNSSITKCVERSHNEKMHLRGAGMSDTGQNPQPDLAGSSPLDAAAVAKVVREELDRNNQYLQFAQGQIEKDRGFL